MPALPQLRETGRTALPTRHRRHAPGWVPNQHGAWAMLIVPFTVGVLDAGPNWRHLPLPFALSAGYLSFYATGLWLRSRCKPRYWPPVRSYGILAVLLGLVVVVIEPELLRWATVFLPLLAISLYLSWRRADRTLLNDGLTVLASCLMPVVVAGVGGHAGRPGTPALAALAWLPGADQVHPWILAGLLLAYFAGTILYVKSMIRDRGNPRRYTLSVAYHVAVCVPAAIASPWLGVLFVALAARAAVVPRRWPGLTPAMIGVGEIAASLALAVSLLLI